MKRILSLCLSLALILSFLAGCGTDPTPTQTAPTDPPQTQPSAPPQTTETAPPPETTDSTEPASDKLQDLRENLPVMDGSTSLIPLEAGLRAALFDISIEDATAQVSHTSSWNSFYNLLNGTADLVFSVPLSDQQWAMAAEQDTPLETIPIAMEGFVFVVNAQNPVDTLTQAQIRDIYSGKITNWSEVGGLDEEIIPYQRNSDSGSQNYMIEFMGDTPLTDAPTELRPASMFGLMEVIAVNDNSRAAIGYSVYAYAADMYGNGDEIKFIKVDGVAPSKHTFADGTYPLMGYNYAVFRSAEPADSFVRQLVDWILTPDGQHAVAEAGYVTVENIGYDYSEAIPDPYLGIGQGAPASESESSEYILTETSVIHYDDGWDYEQVYPQLLPQIVTDENGNQTYAFYQLKNAMLEQEINRWIAQQMIWVREDNDKVTELVNRLNGGQDYGLYTLIDWYLQDNTLIGNSACIVTAKNGILSVAVTLCYAYSGMGSSVKHYRTETASWDLTSGARLTVEELFCRDVEIASVLNRYIKEQANYIGSAEFSDLQTIQDFDGLPKDGWHITHDTIYFDYGNPYFAHGEAFSLKDLPDGTLVSQNLRDFSDAVDATTTQVIRQFRLLDRDTVYEYVYDDLMTSGFLREDSSPWAAAINNRVRQHIVTYFTPETMIAWYDSQGYDGSSIYNGYLEYDWTLYNLGGHYALFRGYAPELYLPESNSFVKYPFPEFLLFDLTTGEQIPVTAILKEGWQDAVTTVDPYDFDLRDAEIYSVYVYSGIGDLQLYLRYQGATVVAGLPYEYIIF